MELSPVIPPGTPVRKEDRGEERSCDNDCSESRFQVCALGPDSASKAQTFESARREAGPLRLPISNGKFSPF